MTSTVAIDRAQKRIKDFKKQCGDDGEAALHLAYHAALPVALNAELLHLLRINFFLDPPEVLPYTVEFEFLLSPLCREIDEGLYEIEPDVRTLLLTGLTETYETERIQEIATLLWQYVEHEAPWSDRIELERAQQLTALNFLDPDRARQWLNTVETAVGQGQVAAREWLVAIRQEIENQGQQSRGEESLASLIEDLHHENSSVRRRAVIALGRVGGEEAIAALIHALDDESGLVRLSTALALGKTGSHLAVPALLSALADADSNVRAGVTKALGQIGHESAIPGLLQALEDGDFSVRWAAAAALELLGYEDMSNDSLDGEVNQSSQGQSQEQSQFQNVTVAVLRSLSTSQEWRFEGDIIKIGSSENNDVVLQARGVSRQHAEISRRMDADLERPTFFLKDYSRYGTLIQNFETGEWQKIHQQEVPLQPGVHLRFGEDPMEFIIVDERFEASATAVAGASDPFETANTGIIGTVLWVDDHPENNTSERLSLKASGIRFVLASSTGEALERIQRQPFDLIITDMGRSLDPQAGYTLLERLRGMGDRTPVIIYSSSRYFSNVAEAQSRGAIGVTNSPTVLMNMVLAVLRRGGQNRANEQEQAMGGTSAVPFQQFVETSQPIETEVKPIEVFISYSYRDADLYEELLKHLALLKRQRVIHGWNNHEIPPGSEWWREISPYVDTANLVLVLVSADLITSEYVWGEEMHRAIARQEAGEAQVIPIILKPVDWTNTPIGELQALPRNAEPITLWDNRDEAFLDVVRGIRAAVERMRTRDNISNNNVQQGQRQETYDISRDIESIYEGNRTDYENPPE